MIVHKEIGMEDMRSRMASVWPSYDKNGEVIYFDETSIENRDNEYPSNYGLLPLDLVFTDKSNWTLNSNGSYRLSFGRVQDIFSFFRSYRHMLSGGASCNLTYASAEEFYEHEASSINDVPKYRFVDDLSYRGGKEYYKALDAKYIELGGDSFYDWLSNNVFPSFEIPMKYRDAWGTERLYVPSVRTWIAWFSERSSYPTDCKTSSDCCDCEKYWKLGGSTILGAMKTWYNGLQTTILRNNALIKNDLERERGIEFSFEYGKDGADCTTICDEMVCYYTETANTKTTFFINHFETENVASLAIKVSNTFVFDSRVDANNCKHKGIDSIGESGYLINGVKKITIIISKIDNTKSSKVILHDSSFGFTPHIKQQTRMVSTVFDLGNESIFYEEYDSSDWYHKGNVVCVDGESKILDSNNGGSEFNDTYFEKRPNGWNIYDGSYREAYPNNSYDVSGKTASRLLDLRSMELLTDDLGNTLEGIFSVSERKNHQPNQNEVLGVMYEVGNTANITEFGDGKYMGDIITKTHFYVQKFDENGDLVTIDVTMPNYSGDAVYCDIEYHIGATLDKDSNGFKVKSGGDSGITYEETVMFLKKKRDYYLKKKNNAAAPTNSGTPIEHTISYPIYVWEMRQNVESVRDGAYGNHDALIAAFKVSPNPKHPNSDMNPINYTDSYPTFREEYNIGINSFQNVDGDIYIDRGVNSAFELHLKLGEVSSLDDLLLYNNGFFSIMEN